MTLSKLFSRCVNRSYIRALQGADYATDFVNGHLIVYFQDSDGAVDWVHNLDFPAVAYKREGRNEWYAHRGFLRVWQALIPSIEPLISEPAVKKITVVGYSHGAALAVLCHEYAWYHRPELRTALSGYGFGCPRVLWGAVSDVIARRWTDFTVIRNRNDIVTHLPPALFGYRHVGTLLEIGEAGKYSAVDAHRHQNIAHELLLYESDMLKNTRKEGKYAEKTAESS